MCVQSDRRLASKATRDCLMSSNSKVGRMGKPCSLNCDTSQLTDTKQKTQNTGVLLSTFSFNACFSPRYSPFYSSDSFSDPFEAEKLKFYSHHYSQ